jgi:hypothetical protein
MYRRQLFVILAAALALVATANAASDLCPDSPVAGACDCTGADGSKQACKCLSSPSSLCKTHLPIICELPGFTTVNGTNETTTVPGPVKRFARAPLQTIGSGDGDGDDPASTVEPASQPTSGAVSEVTQPGKTTEPGPKPQSPSTTSGGTEMTTAEDEQCHCDEKDYYCLSCRNYNLCPEFFSEFLSRTSLIALPKRLARGAADLRCATIRSRLSEGLPVLATTCSGVRWAYWRPRWGRVSAI